DHRLAADGRADAGRARPPARHPHDADRYPAGRHGAARAARTGRLRARPPRAARGGDMSTILSLRHVGKAFRGLVAINDVSLDLAEGTISSLIGPNGAGKSTLFNLITGYLPPSAGEIHFAAQRIDGMATQRIAALGIARAFQIAKPFPELSVLDNVRIGALFGRSGPRDVARVTAEALDVTGLRHFAERAALSLTVGYLRRLELARAIAARPRLLLADEPCAGLNHT